MSCTFWLRRKKKAAKQFEQERLEVERQAEMQRLVEEAARKAAEKKAVKKAAKSDDTEGTV